MTPEPSAPLQLHVDRILEPCCLLDCDGRLTQANQALAELLGLAEPAGRSLRELICERDRHAYDEWLAHTDAEPDLDVRLTTASGHERWTTLRRAGNTAEGRILTLRDVDQRKRAELALIDSEDRFDAFMQSTSASAWMKDHQGRYVWVNQAWEKTAGVSRAAAIGKTAQDLAGENASATLDALDHAVLTTGRPRLSLDVSADGRCFQAVRFLFWDHTGARFLGGMSFDVTAERKAAAELERLHERLGQTQKMEAIGRLASSVAHDFNNLLTVIGSCAENLQRIHQGHARSAEELEQITIACERASNLTRQLLTFSRPGRLEVRPIDLVRELEAIVPLARRIAEPRAEFVTPFASGLPKVLADPSELSQVVLNLVANARDAIGEHGKITCGATQSAGGNVVLFVSDNGCGMDEPTRQRALEPFFTTKEPGKGTGLGLSTVFGIVSRWGATLSLDSAPGRGTTVLIELPPVAAKPAPGARLLLVDDDELVRRATRMMLTQQGHQVTAACDGAAAMNLLESGQAFDLLITDVRMPGMSGTELAERALSLRPALKVLAISGHAGEAHAGSLVLPMLQKPFTYEELDAQVRSLLQR